jgi:site-specific DNA recombinase
MTAAALRCALYARVSTDEQAEKYGLDAQVTELRALAKHRKYTVVGEFVDDGVSGAVLDRPALNRLRDLVAAHGLDVVLMMDSDRLSRDLVNHLLVLDELKRAAVALEYPSHTVDSSPEGMFREQVLGAVSQLERAKIRTRTARGRREKARRGLHPTGKAPFGYRRDESAVGGLAVDPDEANVVRRIFEWVADGTAIRAVAARLDAQGVTPRESARWSRASVRKMLWNDLYTGTGTYNRLDKSGDAVKVRAESEWIRYKVTPVVSVGLAERARAQLDRNKHLLRGRPSRRVFLLGGLAVCGDCGRRMHGDTRRARTTYRCEGRILPKDDRCNFRAFADDLEPRVWAALVAVIRDPETLQSTAKASKLGIDAKRVDAATELADLTKALAKVTTSRDRLIDAYMDERLTRADLDAREPKLKAEIDRLTRALAEAQARVDGGHADADRHAGLVKYCKLVGRGLDRLDEGQRQAFVRKVLTKVVVYAGRVEVQGIFNLNVDGEKPQQRQGGEMVPPCPRGNHFSLRLTVDLGERPCQG